MKLCSISMGRGKMIVEFFSAAMEFRLCRYRSWRADGDSAMTREASFSALDAFISPSAAMIWNRHADARFTAVLLVNLRRGRHLGPGLAARLRLCGHRSLHLLRQLHILDLNPFHLDAPCISGFVQGLLPAVKIISVTWNKSAKWQRIRVFALTCMLCDIPSLSDSSSARFLVPSTFLKVVWASRRVDVCAFDTLATDEMGQCMRKYTTPSTATVTESLVRICRVKRASLPLHGLRFHQ